MSVVEKEHKFDQRVVTFGGGTGHYYLLRGLAELNNPACITAVPGTWDDGGSSGRLRTELGVLPPGDLRQCQLALMSEDQREVAQALFDDRLEDVDGPFKGHSLGNLIQARLERIFRGQDRGVDAARALFKIPSKIIPVCLADLKLMAETETGNTIEGETNIDLRGETRDFDPDDRIKVIYFKGRAKANPAVLQSIQDAYKVVFSAGDLYTSILPHLLFDGIQEGIIQTRARLIFILNLMTKRGETDKYKASDHLKPFLYYLTEDGECLNRPLVMIANENGLNPEIIDFYSKKGQHPVEVDEEQCHQLVPDLTIVRTPLARYLRKEHLLRHDPEKLAQTILELD